MWQTLVKLPRPAFAAARQCPKTTDGACTHQPISQQSFAGSIAQLQMSRGLLCCAVVTANPHCTHPKHLQQCHPCGKQCLGFGSHHSSDVNMQASFSLTHLPVAVIYKSQTTLHICCRQAVSVFEQEEDWNEGYAHKHQQ